MKKTILAFIFAAALLSITAAADGTQTKVFVNGEQTVFNEDTGIPFESQNHRTMVPLRAVMEKFGATVSWDEKTESALLSKDGISLTVTLNSKNLKSGDGTLIPTDEAPLETGGRIYLPIRAVAEAFGGYVLWNEQLNSVFILGDEYFAFRDMFDYNGELSKYVDTVVVSAVYNGEKNKDEFKNQWVGFSSDKADIYLKAIATDKQGLNPDYDIHINFWYPSDEAENGYYLASVSSFSYETKLYNPFDQTEINQLNQ